MTVAARASDRDLRALAGIVSEHRPDTPAADGLPPSLLADLAGQIRCDVVGFAGFDSGRRHTWFLQSIPWFVGPDRGEAVVVADVEPVNWQHYRDCRLCSHPDRTGDLRSVVGIGDFYSTRQWHSRGTRCGICRPMGFDHALMLTLPATADPVPGRTLRLFFFRGPGRDFSERDRALLTLLRPHLRQAVLDAERSRHPTPALTPRQRDLLHLLAAGHTNTQIARRLGISEGTVRTHLKNIYGRLNVTNRTAAVTRAMPDATAIDASAEPGHLRPCPSLQGREPTSAMPPPRQRRTRRQ